MAEEIVSCSGCGKKFRIPDGSPPTGSFACTACGADVNYGGAGAKASSPTGGRASRRSGGRASRAAATPAKETAKATSRGARRARGRNAAEPEPEAADGRGERRQRGAPVAKENKTLPMIIALMGFLLAAGILVVALTGKEPDYDAQAAREIADETTNSTSNGGGIASGTETPRDTSGSDSSGTTAPVPPPPPVAPVKTTVEEPEDDSGIGGVKGGDPSSRAHNYGYFWGKFRQNPDECFKEVPPLEGTSESEAAELKQLADLAFDYNAAAAGARAQDKLIAMGRKAVPFILSQFAKQWNGSKWTDMKAKWAAWQVQVITKRITMKSGPPSEFVARFTAQDDVTPELFQRAATMWLAWWHGEGMWLEKFEPFDDAE